MSVLNILEIAVALLGGFVFGVLFARKNVKKVEAAVADLKAEISKLTGGKVNP